MQSIVISCLELRIQQEMPSPLGATTCYVCVYVWLGVGGGGSGITLGCTKVIHTKIHPH